MTELFCGLVQQLKTPYPRQIPLARTVGQRLTFPPGRRIVVLQLIARFWRAVGLRHIVSIVTPSQTSRGLQAIPCQSGEVRRCPYR